MADLKLEIKQVFDAPIEKVWDAWTNPESLKQWKHPEGMTTPSAQVNLEQGGEWSVVMEGDMINGNEHTHSLTLNGKYLEIDKPHKLVYTWLWEGQDPQTHNTTVTILLSKLEENKTEVILIHSGFPDQNMVDEHTFGWNSTLKNLQKFLQQ